MKFAVLRFRLFVLRSIGFFILFMLVMGVLNAAFDPLHILRAPLEQDVYDRESRFAMPGMIRANSAAHVIFGTSIVQDFDEAYYTEKTGKKLSRYLLTGGTGYEQRRMLETLMRAENVPERVIWGLDPAPFTGALDSIRWDQFPEHLFEKEPFLPAYVFSFQTFHRLVRQLPDRYYYEDGWKTEATRFLTDERKMVFGRDAIYSVYCGDGLSKRLSRLGEFDFSMQDAQIQHNMLAPIKAYPDTEFVLFFPPYSLVQLAEYEKAGIILEAVIAFRSKVFEAVKDLDNVTLYDFQGDISKIADHNQHRDPVHYGSAMMHEISDDFVSGRNLVRGTADIASANARILRALSSSLWAEIEGFCEGRGQPVLGL